ncbi:MAG: hypothetical protein HYW48_00265 [Deltaproteobacteria bacterium]|nr:hypothetical protein [Deltaproteobacteria bacterium]
MVWRKASQLVPPRNPGEATLHSPPQTPLSLFAPSGLRKTDRRFSLGQVLKL